MESEIHDPTLPDSMSVKVRRVALAVVCVALFVIFGIAAPYKIYKHLMSKQDAVGAAAISEEL